MICSGDLLKNGEEVMVRSRTKEPHLPADMQLESAGMEPIPGQAPEPSFVLVCPTCGRKVWESRPRAYWHADAS